MRIDAEKVESVRAFFDCPDNYLNRKRFDIRIRAETAKIFLEGRPCGQMIDIGCGDGSVSLPLLTPQRHLTLLDVSPNMLTLARGRVPSSLAVNVAFRQEDFLKASLEAQSFDVVICLGVLAHVASPNDVIRKAAALLKPGGTLVLECTDSFHFVRRLTSLSSYIVAPFRGLPHRLNRLSGLQVLGLAAQHGFELRDTFRYSWPPPGSQRVFSQDALYRSE